MTELELKEYLFETNQQLLDENVTAEDLLRHNGNIDHLRDRAQDESIDKMVRNLYDKSRTKQNLTGKFRFAMRLHGRIYPEKLKRSAAERLLIRYDE
jgi:hypothetical protein